MQQNPVGIDMKLLLYLALNIGLACRARMPDGPALRILASIIFVARVMPESN
jgi:hypothetical protein